MPNVGSPSRHRRRRFALLVFAGVGLAVLVVLGGRWGWNAWWLRERTTGVLEFYETDGTLHATEYDMLRMRRAPRPALVGKGTGQLLDWQPKGVLVAQESYCQGLRDGISVSYRYMRQSLSERGRILRVDTYEKGVHNGRTVIWHSNGLKAEEGMYNNDQQDGLWLEYDEKGVLIRRTVWKDGKIVSQDPPKPPQPFY